MEGYVLLPWAILLVDFVSIARGFEIDGAIISRPDEIRPAFERAIAVNREGRPYLIDAVVAQRGPGAGGKLASRYIDCRIAVSVGSRPRVGHSPANPVIGRYRGNGSHSLSSRRIRRDANFSSLCACVSIVPVNVFF